MYPERADTLFVGEDDDGGLMGWRRLQRKEVQ